MRATPLPSLRRLARPLVATARARVARWPRAAPRALARGAAADTTRRRSALLLEHAQLRHHLLVRSRVATRPRLPATDRGLLVRLASRRRTWAGALVIVRPETVRRWPRQGYRRRWRRKSRAATSAPRIPRETRDLIRRLARANRLWGAERIRGEPLQRDIRVSKRTLPRDLRQARPPRAAGQGWATVLRNHAGETWACDVLPVTDVRFRPRFACFVVALGTRRVVHVGVTRHPTAAWVAQQRREATPFGEAPRFLNRANDGKYGPRFDRLAAASGIRVRRTPVRAPRAKATCARCLGSVRRECLDHLLILTETHLRRVLTEYVGDCNRVRPQQGLGHGVPPPVPERPPANRRAAVVAIPVLGGRHHDYRRAA